MVSEDDPTPADPDAAFHRAVDDEAARVLRWQSAESKLYPLALADPDLYEAAVGLVVEARDVLRETCASGAELAGADARAVLDRCPSAAAVAGQGFDVRIAVDAARAQRWREMSGGAGATDDATG